MKKFFGKIKGKWLLRISSTLILIAVIIACYIGLNVLVDKLNLEDIDCTEKKLYSLSNETKDKISDLNKDVTIQLINMKEQEYISEYANKYTKITDKINLEEVNDLSARVDLMTKYNLESTDSLIVIKSGEKEKTISTEDLYTYDYSTGKEIDKTEEAITNAIIEVTLDEKPKIYVFTGSTYYEPKQILSTLLTSLSDESNDVNYLDILATGSVPEDCDCLIMTTLSKDISELERDKILEYIQNGGKMMIMTSQNIVEKDTPNFNEILSTYGISIGYGAIFEQDSANMLQGSPEIIVANANASFMNKLDMNLKIGLLDAGKIQFADEEKLEELGVEHEIIAESGEKSFIRTNFDSKSYTKTSEDGEEGSSVVGALVTKKISDDVESKLIIYSNEMFATNMKVQVSNQYYMYALDLYNNEDVILNSISYLTERNNTITIRKTGEEETYTVTDQEDIIIKAIIFTIPAIIIIIGIVIWQVRRRKK